MKSLIFSFVIIVVGFFLTLRNCFWGLVTFCLFTHITPQQLSKEYISTLRLPLLFSGLVFLTYLTSSQYSNKFTVRPIELWLMIAMLVGMSFGLVNSINPDFIYYKLIVFSKYIVFLLLIVNIIDSSFKLNWFTNGLILSSIWLVYRCWTYRGYFAGRFENIDGGVVSDSNHFAAALVMMFPLMVSKILTDDWKVRLFAAIGIFGITCSIVISGSRGGFLGLTADCLAIILLYKLQRKKIIITVSLIAVIMSFYITDHYVERITGIFAPHEIEDSRAKGSAESRLSSWALALDIWKEKPLVGCGVGNFGYYMGIKEGHSFGELGHATHSLWLQTLSEGGLIVFLPFLGLILIFFKRTYTTTKRYLNTEYEYINYNIYALQAGMIGFLVSATFLNRLFYEPIYWWFGLAVAHSVVQKKLLVKA